MGTLIMEEPRRAPVPLVRLGQGEYARDVGEERPGRELAAGGVSPRAFRLEKEAGWRGSGKWVELRGGRLLTRNAAMNGARDGAGATGRRHAVVCTDGSLPFPRRVVFWVTGGGVESRVEEA